MLRPPHGLVLARMVAPQIIHQFWDRPTPPSDAVKKMRSWRDQHRGWRYVRWDDDSASEFIRSEFGDDAAQCFQAAVLPAMRADLLRIAALLVVGGVYADVDMRCIQPVDELLAGRGTLYHGTGTKTGDVKIKNGFIVTEPGSSLFRAAWEAALRNIRTRPEERNISRLAGPILLTSIWRKKLSDAERSAYRLLPYAELAKFVKYGPRLSYGETEGHWTDWVKGGGGAVIDFGRATAVGKKQS